jgi:hypothetical protein
MAGVMFGNHLVLKFAPQKNRRRDGIVLRTGPGIAANSRTNTLFNRGVGFVFDGRPDKDGLVFAGMDFDGVIPQEGEISSFAAERVKRIGSYVEASVSRTGLHVILKARPLTNGDRPQQDRNVYSRALLHDDRARCTRRRDNRCP